MFELLYPPAVLFGWGVRERLGEVLDRVGASRVVLVASRPFVTAGALPEWEGLSNGRIQAHVTGIPHDPSLSSVEEIARLVRCTGADCVLAVGGGSVIDAAKAAAVWAPLNRPLADYFHGEAAIERPGLPLIALPTTAGTGAEITKNAVLTDVEALVKKSLRSPHMVPAAAIVDVELTVRMPPELTAASGLDALTQAVESFISLKAHAVSRALALAAVERLMPALPTVFHDGTDREGRTSVAEGSLLSAMAFSQSGLGAAHGLAHPLGLTLDLPHGYVCAVLLPHILRWNLPVVADDLVELARATGKRTGEEFVDSVTRLCAELRIPQTFVGDALCEDHFPAIIANCRSGSMAANPRPMTDDDVRALLARLTAA